MFGLWKKKEQAPDEASIESHEPAQEQPKKQKKAEKQISEKPVKEKKSLDGEYPGLSGLNYGIGYMEQLLAALSEPLLIGCSALAVIDFITGGGILAIPLFSYAWASALAIAVTACFIVTWRRALRALSLNRYGAAFFLAVLGAGLGVVDWTAVATQSLMQSLTNPDGSPIKFATALKDLGFDPFWLTNIRAGVAIAMAVVVAISNHSAVTTATAPKRRLAVWEKMLNQIAPVVTEQSEQGTVTKIEQVEQRPVSPAPVVHQERKQARLTVVSMNHDNEPRERVRRALEQKPGCSDRELGRLAGMAPLTAKKYREQVEHSRALAQQKQLDIETA